MSVKLLVNHHVAFLSLKRGYTVPFESTLVKMPHCRKSHVMAHLYIDSSMCCSQFGKYLNSIDMHSTLQKGQNCIPFK